MVMNQLLISREVVPRQLSYTPRAQLIGKAGVGKTTLADNLSKIRHEEDVNKLNMNQEENDYFVICDRNAFVLIDTPGIDLAERPSTEADSQETDTRPTISTLFFVIKYDTRFRRMMKVYSELKESVANDADRIVVMISHWDLSKNPEKDFKEICDLFARECPHLANIIFYSEQYVDTKLARLMYSCISNMEKVELNDTGDHVEEERPLTNNQTSIFNKRQSASDFRSTTDVQSKRFSVSVEAAVFSSVTIAVTIAIICYFRYRS